MLDSRQVALNMGINKAIRTNNPDEITRLVKEGNADINYNDGRTALHLAISLKQLDCAKRLIELGADMMARDTNNKTPLLYAIELQQMDGVRLLVESGADINQTTVEGCTVLHHAIGFTFNDAVKYLLEQGIKVNQQNDKGMTALHCAWGNNYGIKILLSNGADPNIQDNQKQSVLHCFIKQAFSSSNPHLTELLLESTKLLVEHGADYLSPVHLWKSYLSIVKDLEITEIVDYLESHQQQNQLKALIEGQNDIEGDFRF